MQEFFENKKVKGTKTSQEIARKHGISPSTFWKHHEGFSTKHVARIGGQNKGKKRRASATVTCVEAVSQDQEDTDMVAEGQDMEAEDADDVARIGGQNKGKKRRVSATVTCAEAVSEGQDNADMVAEGQDVEVEDADNVARIGGQNKGKKSRVSATVTCAEVVSQGQDNANMVAEGQDVEAEDANEQIKDSFKVLVDSLEHKEKGEKCVCVTLFLCILVWGGRSRHRTLDKEVVTSGGVCVGGEVVGCGVGVRAGGGVGGVGWGAGDNGGAGT